jgi:hypothetical protein
MISQNFNEYQESNHLFEAPDFEVVGTLDSIVLSGGYNNDDGWGYSKLAF